MTLLGNLSVGEEPRKDRLDDAVYTIQEVTGILRVNEATVRRMIQDETLRVVRCGRAVRIPREELEIVLECGWPGPMDPIRLLEERARRVLGEYQAHHHGEGVE